MESCSLQSTLASPTCSFGEFIITFFWWQGVPLQLASDCLSSRNRWGQTDCEEVTPVCKTCLGDVWVLISRKGAVLTRDFCVLLPSKLSSNLKVVQKHLLHCCHEDPNQMIRWYSYPPRSLLMPYVFWAHWGGQSPQKFRCAPKRVGSTDP